jgi:small subunit ribosomal protein S6
MVLFDSNKYAGDREGVVNHVHGLLEKHHCTVLASRPWDERRLTYPIGNHKKGMFYLIYFQAEGKSLVPLQSDIHLTESIIRTMILKIDTKLVDTMLAMAKDEHAYALQAPGLADEPVGGGPSAEGEAHGERGR